MHYNGNVAYKIEIPAEKLSKAVSKNKKKRFKLKISPAVWIAVFIAVVFLTVFRWITITGQMADITKKTTELNKIIAENQSIKVQIEQKTKKTIIYDYATGVLGMITPSKSQIIYVNITPEE
jgi:cytoskeletal protein RodZ